MPSSSRRKAAGSTCVPRSTRTWQRFLSPTPAWASRQKIRRRSSRSFGKWGRRTRRSRGRGSGWRSPESSSSCRAGESGCRVSPARGQRSRLRCPREGVAIRAPPDDGLLDDLIRPRQERRRDRQTERFGGLQIDQQVELGGLLDGQVAGLGAFEGAVHIAGGAPAGLWKVWTVLHEIADGSKTRLASHRRQAMLEGDPSDFLASAPGVGTRQGQYTTRLLTAGK